MVMTKRGVYHNLNESEYAVSNGEIAFLFSSKFYLRKFMNEHEDYRVLFIERLSKTILLDGLNADLLADIHFYKEVEKRGFKAFLFIKMAKIDSLKDLLQQEGDISWQELHQFALARMTKQNTLDWSEMPVLK